MAQGKRGAFYNTLEEFHKYWERIDIICPRGPVARHPHGAQLLFARHGGPPLAPPLAPFVLFDNVFIHQSPWPLIFQSWWILKKGREIYREHKFDLITVHEYPPFYNGIGARLLWNKIKVPYVLEIFHIPGHPKAADFKEVFYKKLSRIFLKFDSSKARAVRTMNQKQVPEFLIKAGVPKEKIIYIPAIYIDLDIFKPMDLEKKYDLIFIGRLAKNKGIDLLIEAFKLLHSTYYLLNSKLLIVGDGPLRNYCKLKIGNWKLQDNVVLYGWARDSKEIARLLNQSKILIMPSYNEGGPRVIIEAMACGIPILATSVGIVADIIKDGQFGQLIDWNLQDIAEKARALLINESKYQKYSEAAKETANQFEKKSAIRNYADKLQELI